MIVSPQSQLVFVYGSLKRGYKLHYLLESQLFVADAVTQPLYRLFDLGSYPGLIEWPEGLAIHGEVYQVDADGLTQLDEVEGVAERLYVRRQISLQTSIGDNEIQAWFWLGSVQGLRDCGTAWP